MLLAILQVMISNMVNPIIKRDMYQKNTFVTEVTGNEWGIDEKK